MTLTNGLLTLLWMVVCVFKVSFPSLLPNMRQRKVCGIFLMMSVCQHFVFFILDFVVLRCAYTDVSHLLWLKKNTVDIQWISDEWMINTWVIHLFQIKDKNIKIRDGIALKYQFLKALWYHSLYFTLFVLRNSLLNARTKQRNWHFWLYTVPLYQYCKKN